MNQENPYQPPKSEVADVHSADESELATRGARFGAAMIDGLLMLIVIFPFMAMLGVWEAAQRGQEMSFEQQVQIMVIGAFGYLIFHGYLLTKSGQTIGKRLVGIRIVSVDENRLLPLFKVVGMRYMPIAVGGLIPIIGPFVGLVDPLFIFRNDRRCLHDLIAGTKVVKAEVPFHP